MFNNEQSRIKEATTQKSTAKFISDDEILEAFSLK